MARSEARIYAEIWEDGDFIALDPASQRLYMFLLSQPDLAHSGVIPLRERRWSKKAAGVTTADIERDLKTLEAGRFIVVDWDAEEVLIRAFMRRDKVYRQPNVMRSAVDHVAIISSPIVLAELTAEVERIETLEMTANAAEVVADMKKELVARVAAIGAPQPVKGTGNPSENPSAKGCELRPGDRGIDTAVTTEFPVPLTPGPGSPDPQAPLFASLTDGQRSAEPPKPTTLNKRAVAEAFAAFWNVYPRRVSRGAAEKAFATAVKTTDPDLIVAGAVAYRDHGPRQRAEIQYTKHPSTWLNGKCWLDDLPADDARASPNSNGHRAYQNPTDQSKYEEDL